MAGPFDDLLEGLIGKPKGWQEKLREGTGVAENERVATLARKSQYLIDLAYNRALEDMAVTSEDHVRAGRLRRIPRHEKEFKKR